MGFHIKNILIRNLWQIKGDVYWELNEDVNILVGNNGTGKSTILSLLATLMKSDFDFEENNPRLQLINSAAIRFSDHSTFSIDIFSIFSKRNFIPKTKYKYVYLNTFDVKADITGSTTVLDKLIADYREPFVRYQRNLSQKIQAIYETGSVATKEDYARIFGKKNLFIQQINQLFASTKKIFIENDFAFQIENQSYQLSPEQLSSGEKQVFLILLMALLQENEPCVFLMDEPEMSLHIDWQREIIRFVRALNENSQLIIVTHSPTIFFRGWSDKMKNIEDILFVPSYTDAAFNKPPFIDWEEQVREKEILLGHSITEEEIIKVVRYEYPLKIQDFKNLLATIYNKLGAISFFTFQRLLYDVNNTNDNEFYKLIDEIHKYKIKYSGINISALFIPQIVDFEIAWNILREDRTEIKVKANIQVLTSLLCKAKNKEQIARVEELRQKYGIKEDESYKQRLKIRQ